MVRQDKTSKLLDSIRKRIKPDMGILKDVDRIVGQINGLLKDDKISAECVKGGSIAKETFLKNDYDIDLFVRFNPSYIEQDISGIVEVILNKLCKVLKIKTLQKVHGSRDYFQFSLKKESKELIFEVIPVILIHASNYSEAQNITDLSPEHVTWVKKHTDKHPELIDDIRLAKQFCKANRVYGAESYVNGFSGHILDILVIYYGSFISMLKALSKNKDASSESPIVVDPEKHHKDPVKALNKSKIAPLIIVDPIQKDRNSAAALSVEKLNVFIDAAKEFLKKPDEKFFEIKKIDIDKQANLSAKKFDKKNILIVKADIHTLDGSKDVVGTKILKVYEAFIEHLKLNEFKVLDSGWNFDFEKRAAKVYIIVDKNISRDVEQEGPPVSAKIDYEKFMKKHNGLGHKTFIKGNRAYVIMPRKYTDSIIFLSDLSKDEFIRKRFKSISIK